MSRKGKGSVIVNGHVMTTEDYKNAVRTTIETLGNNWLDTNTILAYASANEMMEPKNTPRKGDRHPIWKILSIMYYEDGSIKRRKNNRGLLEYQL